MAQLGDVKPLFDKWLEDAAVDATRKGTKSALLYNKALARLRAFDGPINDTKTLRSIQFVGEKTVEHLVKRLRSHCEAQGCGFPAGFETAAPETASAPAPKRQRKASKYIPRKRSGGYAIVLALYMNDQARRGMKREDIQRLAAPYCDKSFSSNPGNNEFYSAWNSVKSLEKHELISITGRSPRLYLLTDEGLELAKLLRSSEGINSSPAVERVADISFENNVRVTPKSSKSAFALPLESSPLVSQQLHDTQKKIFSGIPYDIWTPDEYSVVLLVDNREVRSQQERTYFQDRLSSLKVKCDVRQLPVGDVCWIAKHKTTGREVVLNTICERKRLDDLASSIKDGRFVEQKNRLVKASMKSYYYLVEEGAADLVKYADFATSIQTAQSMTMTVSKFKLRKFKQIDDTTSFLASLTEVISESLQNARTKLVIIKPRTINNQDEYGLIIERFRAEFENKSWYECVHLYSNFNDTMTKTNMLTLKEVFLCMLLTIRGVSLEKALAIQNVFATPKALIEFFTVEHQNKSPAEKAKLLSDKFKDEIGNKKIGKALSQKIYEIWGDQ